LSHSQTIKRRVLSELPGFVSSGRSLARSISLSFHFSGSSLRATLCAYVEGLHQSSRQFVSNFVI